MADSAPEVKEKNTGTVTISIDGKKIEVKKGATVLEAARQAGIYIPNLCDDPDLRPYGACCMCVVEIEGMRGLPTSCTTPVTDGMVIHSDSTLANESRLMTMQLILANHPSECLTCSKNQDCELQKIARYLGVEQANFDKLRKRTKIVPIDNSHPAYMRDMNKCILCGKCWRACDEIAGVDAIDIAYRGDNATVVGHGDKPILESDCEACGECIDRCPTGALTIKNTIMPTREVKTICPYCGVGCSIYLGIRGNQIVRVRGDKESPVNKGGLCVKGRFGFDFINHPERLTTPLIRKDGVDKDAKGDIKDLFREATWEEAISLAAEKLSGARQKYGPNGLGIISSAKFTNEENYLVQKFARAVIGTNNVDHCARLCHASTVAAAALCFGDGAMSNSISDFTRADILFIIGSNTSECHPIIARYIRQTVKQGKAKLILADPRTISLAKLADIHVKHQPGTDVALLNAMIHVIIKEGLENKDFIRTRTIGYDEMAKTVEKYTPEIAESITGVPKDEIIRIARLFATGGKAAILYGMGITQHTTGTDNVKSVANLLMVTGNMGTEGTGFSPLRGQNNVQGACDMGALPNVLPGYQKVIDAEVRQKFEKAWNCTIQDKPGLPMTEMMNAADEGTLKAVYLVGENPMLSEPDTNHTRHALQKLEYMVVQDIFPTETVRLADVVLPAAAFAEKDGTYTNTERRVQKVNKATEPPGSAKADWEITSMIANKMGYPFPYKSMEEINAEMRSLTPIYAGISINRLNACYGLQWPCRTEEDPGTAILHQGTFTCGLGNFMAVEYKPPVESVSTKYPLILTTGRILEHFHTGSMSRRAKVLDELYPYGSIDIHPDDAMKLNIANRDLMLVESERGQITLPVNITEKAAPGIAFLAFHWTEAPANMLTINALDPTAKIPEFKVSAIKADRQEGGS